jgi:hypothetical protein
VAYPLFYHVEMLDFDRSSSRTPIRRNDVRPVNEVELVWNVKFALGDLLASYRNVFKSAEKGVRDRAAHGIAMRIAAQLRRYEILRNTKVPEGSDLFSRAAFRGFGSDDAWGWGWGFVAAFIPVGGPVVKRYCTLPMPKCVSLIPVRAFKKSDQFWRGGGIGHFTLPNR